MAAVPMNVALPTKAHSLWYAAGTSFLRTFAVTFLSFAVGILGATNQGAAVALSIAALAASVAAAIRSVQVFFPAISFDRLLPQPWAAYADAFVRAFLAVFTTTLAGWLAAPNWGLWHSALTGALIAAGVAAVRALQGLVTPGEVPFADKPGKPNTPPPAVPPTPINT